MFFPSPLLERVVKDSPNHIIENMVGWAQTSCKILEDNKS